MGGTLWCWGSNSWGQLGLGDTTSRSTPTKVGSFNDWEYVTAGAYHTCATRWADQLYCWGANDYGQVGIGSSAQRILTPTFVRGGVVQDGSFSAGLDYTCASASILTCWGKNTSGQLGTGDTVSRNVPTAVVRQIGANSIIFASTSVAAGDAHTCAIDTGKKLYCWGSNASGQFGNGGTTSSTTPVAVSSSVAWAEVTAGTSHTCARSTGNALYCWGANTRGQLGVGTTSQRLAPAYVGSGWSQVDAGSLHTCGEKPDGSGRMNTWCWGASNYYQVGDGGTTDRLSPVSAGTSGGITSAGRYHSCDLTGSVYCWGLNSSSQSGQPSSTTTVNTPTAVPGT